MWLTSVLSRSTPSVSCVRSFEPMEKPSSTSRNSRAERTHYQLHARGRKEPEMTFEGISHIPITFRPFSPCTKPFFAISATTLPNPMVGESSTHTGIHLLGLGHSATERNHRLQIRQAKLLAHTLHLRSGHLRQSGSSPLTASHSSANPSRYFSS